jgi:hypothetical protein
MGVVRRIMGMKKMTMAARTMQTAVTNRLQKAAVKMSTCREHNKMDSFQALVPLYASWPHYK